MKRRWRAWEATNRRVPVAWTPQCGANCMGIDRFVAFDVRGGELRSRPKCSNCGRECLPVRRPKRHDRWPPRRRYVRCPELPPAVSATVEELATLRKALLSGLAIPPEMLDPVSGSLCRVYENEQEQDHG